MKGFTTNHERALEELYVENAESSPKYNACLDEMATRIATVFASLKVISKLQSFKFYNIRSCDT